MQLRESLESSSENERRGPRLLFGTVVNSEGEPISDAVVSWTVWDPAFLAFVRASVPVPVDLLAGRTRSCGSGPGGEFAFFEAPESLDDSPSILWVTHPDFRSASLELQPEEVSDLAAREFQLKEEEGTIAIVQRNSAPVSKATVTQRVVFEEKEQADLYGGVNADRASVVFFREYETSEDGGAALSSVNGLQWISARKEEDVSAPWRGERAPTVTLELSPSFSVSGFVDREPGTDHDVGDVRVEIWRYYGCFSERLAVLAPGLDGEIAPTRIPLKPADSLIARLDGGMYVMQEAELGMPVAGEHVRIEMFAAVGYPVWYLAVDEFRNTIPHAVVEGTWEFEGRSYSKRAVGREDGYIPLLGIPDCLLNSKAWAKGRGMVTAPTTPVPITPAGYFTMVIGDGYTLKGQVLRGLAPVEDFELRYWPTENTNERGSILVTGSETGEFQIENLPTRKVAVMAIDSTYGRSETVHVDVKGLGESEVVLQIEDPHVAHGIVIDSSNGTPIPGALITAYSSFLYRELDAIGNQVSANQAGRFELARLTEGLNVISIEAPGYSQRELKVYSNSGGVTDLGQIELPKTQPLRVSLLLPEGQDPTKWMLTADGIGAISDTRFDATGVIAVDAASAGYWRFVVRDFRGMGEELLSEGAWLRAGEDWDLEFDLRNGRTLVLLAPLDEMPPNPTSVTAIVKYTGIGGNRRQKVLQFNAEGEAFLHSCVAPGPVVVSVPVASSANASGGLIYEVTEEDLDEVILDIEFDRADSFFRVLDSRGAPLPGVLIDVRSSEYPGLQIAQGVTGAAGEVGIRGVPVTADRVNLTSSKGGIHAGIELDLVAPPGDYIELVFEDDASIELIFKDQGRPQSDVTARLWSEEGGLILTSGLTPDEEGRLEFTNLCPGNYELRVSGARHWPVRQVIEAKSGGSAQTIQVRESGSLQIQLVRSDGSLAANEPVELRCLSLDEDVSAWIVDGRIQGVGLPLRTNAQGKLELGGVPHGDYRWSAAGHSAEFRVEAGQSLPHRVVLP